MKKINCCLIILKPQDGLFFTGNPERNIVLLASESFRGNSSVIVMEKIPSAIRGLVE
jgi:hypothetical protein